MVDDLAPMLHQEADNSPQLGGTHRIVTPCPNCGGDRLRDFFGNLVCPECVNLRPTVARPTRMRLETDPEWFNAASNSVADEQIKRVRVGLHPMGSKLLDEAGKTCGNCKFLHEHHSAGTYFKCRQHKMTHGPATDVRKGWPACVRHEAKENEG